MSLDTPIKFSAMSRQGALTLLAENEKTHQDLHAYMGDRWYSEPLHHSLKAESAFLRENLNRFPL
jgi:hypothetical protein